MKEKQPIITITTASALSAAQKKQAETVVANRAGKVTVTFATDPTVLGGIKVTVGGQTFDATLEGQLKQLALSAHSCSVVTAIALTASQRKTLFEAIRTKYGSVSIVETVDPTVIGGIKVIVGSKEYNFTVADKLARLKQQTVSQI